MNITRLKILFFLFFPLVFSAQNNIDALGKRQGAWKKKYPGSSVIQYKGQFKDDKPIGTFKYYYTSKSIRAVIIHDDNSNRSYAEFYHENGNMMSKGIYRNMLKDSIWVNYTPSGRMSSKETFRNDTLNGLRTIYYLPEDLYNKKIMIASETNFKNGKVEGEQVEYFDTGKIKSKKKFKNNVKHGECFINHPNGKVMNYERYKNGVLHGWCYVKDQNGSETARNYYFKGELLQGKKLEQKLQYLKSKGLNPNE